MDFKTATDSLFAGISHEELAKQLGVSIATVRQARLGPDARARRTPPRNWEVAVAKLARDKASYYQYLAEMLSADTEM